MDPTNETKTPETKIETKTEAPATPFAVFPDAESFNKRVDREAKKHLRELGFDDPNQIKTALGELEQLRAAKAEAERAQMTELERYKADLAAHQAELEKIRAEAEDARLRARMSEAFGKAGVKNYDYAVWRCVQAANALPEGETLNLDEYLAQISGDPTERAALGLPLIETAPPAPPVIGRPANTSPAAGGAPAAPPANGAPQLKTAMDMTPQEWAAHKSQMGVHV